MKQSYSNYLFVFIICQGLAFNVNGADNQMSRARALVGHFSSSSQASEALANVQRRGPNTKTLVVMQGVKHDGCLRGR